MSAPTDLREFTVGAGSSGTFGRVLCRARNHHFVVDGPVQNGCPGEALTPAELFLSGVASCGIELVEVFAREEGIPLARIDVSIHGVIDRANRLREDVMVFNSVAIDFVLRGVTADQANHLVGRFRKTCPLYGSVAVATPDTRVTVGVAP